MDGQRFDTLIHARQSGSPTRRALARPLVALAMTIGWGALLQRAAARKGKRRKTCKKTKPGPTCPGSCPGACQLCATRREGSPVCGDTVVFTCGNACATDTDCVGKVFMGFAVPYCITGYTPSGGQFAPIGCDGACAGFTPCQ